MTYQAPIKGMLSVMSGLAGLDNVVKLPGFEDATADTVRAALGKSARFIGEVVTPLNVEGDRSSSSWKNGIVMTAAGLREALVQLSQGGWQGVQHPLECGGQDLSKLIVTMCIEMLNAANLSLALCLLLMDGVIETLLTAGTEEQKQLFAPKLISGEWTGMINLIEPQAGSDLALAHTHAEPADDGTFKIFGTKIFITWGEYDVVGGIVRLVLACTSSAPEGIERISLSAMPKFMVSLDSSLDARDDARCVSIRHELGTKTSPTVVLQFDGNGGAVGTLAGEEDRGLEYMLIIMNATYYAVGMQDVGASERAYQKVVAYAYDRVQNRPMDGSAAKAVPIIHHSDVRRMLLTMHAMAEGARALTCAAAAACDVGHHPADNAARKQNATLYESLMPIVKGQSTGVLIDVTSLGMQVHGGMGSIEETGAAQLYRDARILPIHKGTMVIQANDPIGRETVRDGGAAVLDICAKIAKVEAAPAAKGSAHCDAMRVRLTAGRGALESVVQFVVRQTKAQPNAVSMGSMLCLWLCGTALSSWQVTCALLAAIDRESKDPNFYGAKIVTVCVFVDMLLMQASSIAQPILTGGETTGTVSEAQL